MILVSADTVILLVKICNLRYLPIHKNVYIYLHISENMCDEISYTELFLVSQEREFNQLSNDMYQVMHDNQLEIIYCFVLFFVMLA